MTTPNQDAFPIQFRRHLGILASPWRVITETPSWVDEQLLAIVAEGS